MFSHHRPLALAAGITLILSACASSSGNSLADYASSGGVPVKTRCGAYLVAQHPTAPQVLVTPYAGNAVQAICEEIRGGQVSYATTGVAYEDGAREFLAADPSRAGCRITGGERLTPLHSQFSYACPVAPASATTVSVKG